MLVSEPARRTAEALRVLVEDVRLEADGVLSLQLAATDGSTLPAWEPGAHVTVLLPSGDERSYSLCGVPDERHRWRLAVLREPGGRGGSAWIHASVRAGQTLDVRGPANGFPLVDADDYLFIAGGIGITPILPMVAQVERAKADWKLLYGGRMRRSMAFLDELAVYGDAVSVCPEDEVGLLDLRAFLGDPRDRTAVYCCGPESLIAAVLDLTAAWPAGAVHVERFRPRAGALDGPAGAFEVVIASSGQTLTVGPGESVAEVLETAGVDIPTSCREGTCGTCEVAVLEGIPDHRDSFLSEEEQLSNETMMVCCSRAHSPRVVLDL